MHAKSATKLRQNKNRKVENIYLYFLLIHCSKTHNFKFLLKKINIENICNRLFNMTITYGVQNN